MVWWYLKLKAWVVYKYKASFSFPSLLSLALKSWFGIIAPYRGRGKSAGVSEPQRAEIAHLCSWTSEAVCFRGPQQPLHPGPWSWRVWQHSFTNESRSSQLFVSKTSFRIPEGPFPMQFKGRSLSSRICTQAIPFWDTLVLVFFHLVSSLYPAKPRFYDLV